MIPIVTSKEMRAIDEAAIGTFRVPSLDLMEAAGTGVAEAVESHFGAADGRNILVVCGRGNNGGDGLVAARVLREKGARVTVVVTAEKDSLSADAKTNLDRWTSLGGSAQHLASPEEVEAFFQNAPETDLAIDALLGTGSAGAPRGAVLAAVRGISALHVPVVSVDIPSGIDADTGLVSGDAIHAALTVTLALPKRGHYLQPSRENTGLLEVLDIGIPREAALAADIADFLIEPDDVRDLLPERAPASHKGSRGRLLLVGGSVGLTGALVLAGNAAARIGAGRVTVGVPQSLCDIFEVKLTEVMKLPLDEGSGPWLGPLALDGIRKFAKDGLSALVLGPGMSRSPESLELARSLVKSPECPKVVDADALFAFNGSAENLARKVVGASLVLTPHTGEASRLFGKSVEEIEADRIDFAAEWAERLGQVLVLKGAPTVIGTPEGETFVNPTGGPALATGGTGDVLAGMIGGLLAQGLSPVHAAIAGVYLHGHAADLVVEKGGVYGMIAGDLVPMIPEAMNDLAGT